MRLLLGTCAFFIFGGGAVRSGAADNPGFRQIPKAFPQALDDQYQGDSQQRLRNFPHLIHALQGLVEDKKVSQCAAYAYLFGELYQSLDRDVPLTLEAAVYFLSNPYTIGEYLNVVRNALDVRQQPAAAWEVLKQAYARITQRSATGPGIRAVLSRESRVRLPNTVEGIQRLNGGEYYYPPEWLYKHEGQQGLAKGYRQADADETGRHDHLVFNMIVGSSLESVLSSGDDSIRSLPRNWAADGLRGSFGWVMDTAFERSVGTGSRTDIAVNQAGRKLGRDLLRPGRKPLNGQVMNSTIYAALCDESRVEPAMKGPLYNGPLKRAFFGSFIEEPLRSGPSHSSGESP